MGITTTRMAYGRHDQNVAASSGGLTASSEDADYPATNLVNLNPALPGKLTATTGWWKWQYAARQKVDAVALIHHNLDSALQIYYQANDTDVWTAPTMSEIISIPPYRYDGFPVSPAYFLEGKTGYTTSGFYYHRIYIPNANSVNVAIGEVVLIDTINQLDINVSWGYADTEERPIVEHRTDIGVSTVYDYGVLIRSLSGTLETTDAGASGLRQIFQGAHGRARAWLLVPEPTTNVGDRDYPTYEAWLVRHASTKQTRGHTFADVNTMELSVEEVSRGLPL